MRDAQLNREGTLVAQGGDAAIYYEPDAYGVVRGKVMGRHSAGESFLRAIAAERSERDLWCYAASRTSADAFARQVHGLNPAARGRWCPSQRLDLLGQIGCLYYPAPDIAPLAALRLRRRMNAFSLCGVTHTTASDRVMEALGSTLRTPLAPWDAIICTSSAVRETVLLQRAAEADYVKWRFGGGAHIPEGPQFPIIPLGVHAADFAVTDEERAGARQELGIGADEVVFLFVGRLSFHAKAHPDVMYRGLERATRSGKKITLIQCGWFANEAIEHGFRSAAAASAPHVKALFTDGTVEKDRRRSWAAADVFISLSDNIQETFGLTPLEAMARGIPVIVSDWDGYRDTVRDGLDGFRVPTTMPPPGAGTAISLGYEAKAISYDRYCGYTCAFVSLEEQALAEKVSVLVENPDLLREMGANGRQRAETTFEWGVIIKIYQDLWHELGAIRLSAMSSERAHTVRNAPPYAPGKADPFTSFAHYPTHVIDEATKCMSAARVDGQTYEHLINNPLFEFAQSVLPSPNLAASVRAGASGATVAALAEELGLPLTDTIRAVGVLAKMGLISLRQS